jgi:predicted MPP superfamily phosphohydrolase
MLPPGSGKYNSGLYATKYGPLYVSRGIGTSVISLRIGARPEIAEFELK